MAYYLAHSYTFISTVDVLNGLDPQKKYVLITFDDGYYKNHLALPILRRYGMPVCHNPATILARRLATCQPVLLPDLSAQ